MGFEDSARNIRALHEAAGDLQGAIDTLVDERIDAEIDAQL